MLYYKHHIKSGNEISFNGIRIDTNGIFPISLSNFYANAIAIYGMSNAQSATPHRLSHYKFMTSYPTKWIDDYPVDYSMRLVAHEGITSTVRDNTYVTHWKPSFYKTAMGSSSFSFVQPTATNQPVWNTAFTDGNNRSFPFLGFFTNGKSFLQANENLLLDTMTNGGFTIVSILRYESSPTQFPRILAMTDGTNSIEYSQQTTNMLVGMIGAIATGTNFSPTGS